MALLSKKKPENLKVVVQINFNIHVRQNKKENYLDCALQPRPDALPYIPDASAFWTQLHYKILPHTCLK